MGPKGEVQEVTEMVMANPGKTSRPFAIKIFGADFFWVHVVGLAAAGPTPLKMCWVLQKLDLES